jgi:hypothetical protein
MVLLQTRTPAPALILLLPAVLVSRLTDSLGLLFSGEVRQGFLCE